MENQGMVSALSDAELLANTRGLIGRSNQVFAALLAHLGEVEARGLHRTRACSSLYAYCIYELRLSEDGAVRRVAAARLVRRFPELLEAVAAGEVHLTGLLMLGPHLTRENFRDVMARAKHRTKKEIAKLVRILDPLPAVPAWIEALGPALPGAAPSNPSWAEQVASFCPVRELQPGDRPKDWLEPDELPAPARQEAKLEQPKDWVESDELSAPASPARQEAKLEQPLRYKVQFTATEEHIDLMERAAALLSNRGEHNGIEEIHLRALRALVEELEKRRYGAPQNMSKNALKPAARPARHIPARVRRTVFDRDGACCTHVDPSGQRCCETHRLELHHLVPFARGGGHTAANLTLRCAAHNAYAAELDFSPEHIAMRRDSCSHESARRAEREANPRAG
jgi:hypothetical protein